MKQSNRTDPIDSWLFLLHHPEANNHWVHICKTGYIRIPKAHQKQTLYKRLSMQKLRLRILYWENVKLRSWKCLSEPKIRWWVKSFVLEPLLEGWQSWPVKKRKQMTNSIRWWLTIFMGSRGPDHLLINEFLIFYYFLGQNLIPL